MKKLLWSNPLSYTAEELERIRVTRQELRLAELVLQQANRDWREAVTTDKCWCLMDGYRTVQKIKHERYMARKSVKKKAWSYWIAVSMKRVISDIHKKRSFADGSAVRVGSQYLVDRQQQQQSLIPRILPLPTRDVDEQHN